MSKPSFNLQGAIAKAMTSPNGIATIAELAEAAQVDLSNGPPWDVRHPIFQLAAALAEHGVVQIESVRGLDTRFQMSAMRRAPKGARRDN